MKENFATKLIPIILIVNIFLMIPLVESQKPANITESALSAEAKSLLSSAKMLSINGTRFNDSNLNGIIDEGENGLAGTIIRLMQNGMTISITVTNEYGHYDFNNLGPGQYTVVEEQVKGWNQTSPRKGLYNVSLTDASIQNLNFGDTGGIITIGRPKMVYYTPEQIQEAQRIYASLPKVNISPTMMSQIKQTAGEDFSLMNYLHYMPSERYQGSCGNCWVWGSTALMEIDNAVKNSNYDRLSIQYFSSNYNGGTGCGFDCCGGMPYNVVAFYSNDKQVIPWDNNNANPFADDVRCCSLACNPQGCDPGTTVVAANAITEDPHFRIASITCNPVNTIDEIKALLKQKKAVTFSFWQSSGTAFENHWNNNRETDVFNPGSWGGSWGHTVTCVGYNDTDPSNPYWKMLNSWGLTANRENGLFAVTMNLDYSSCQFYTFDINWMDNFGYTLKDSNSPGGPTYNWIEISGDGTSVLPNSDDRYVSNIPLGFFFNYYGTDYSQLAISNNGLLFSGAGSTQYVNEPIKQSTAVHGFIAPFWDDIVTWGTPAGSIYYKTIGNEPNRMFVVEWKDNQHYDHSTEGITFEAILYEGSNNIQFQYLDTTFGSVTGSTGSDLPPYDLGGSATVGIESPAGDDGLQYSYNEQVINPGLAILYKFPQFAGSNLYLSKQAPASKDRGSTMVYTMHYQNFGDTAAQNVVLKDILPSSVEYISSSDGGSYDSNTRTVTWNIGSLAPIGHGYRTITVRIPQSTAIGTVIQNEASISTSNLEVRYDDNQAHTQTRVTGSSLPPNVGVEPNLGGTTTSVYWTTPITFSYHNPSATCVNIRIHLDDGGPDITGSMINGPPDWTYTTTFYPRTGHATVTYTVCGGTPISFDIYIDPAGYIYDIDTNARIGGASVWLQRPDGTGDWENVPTGQTPPIMQPDTNPLITGVDGQYQWDVLTGSYRVHVEAAGYYPQDSIVVSIPPPVTDLHVGLTRIPSTTTNLVALQAANGQYLCAEGSGGGAVVANRNGIGGWETFKLIELGNYKVALQAANGQYLCAEGSGGGAVVANRNAIGGWETFELCYVASDKVALKAANGQFLCAEGGGGGSVVANRNAIGGWEMFKLVYLDSDVAIQATNGQFLCAEGSGGGAVVANRNGIGGWETFKLIDQENDKIALQAANGQYLCAEGSGGGAVVANRNGIAGWERFKFINRDGYFALQAANGQYVCAEGGGGQQVVANRNGIGGWETFRFIDLRRPAKVVLRAANGQYVCAEGGGGQQVVANRNGIGAWETFRLIDRGNGMVALQATNGQFLCAEGGGGGAVVANRNGIAGWETFMLIYERNGNVALKAANGQYLCAEGGGGGAVVANRNGIGGWETFNLIPA